MPRTPATATEVPRAWHTLAAVLVALLVGVAAVLLVAAASSPGVAARSTGASTATAPRSATLTPVPLLARPAATPASLLHNG